MIQKKIIKNKNNIMTIISTEFLKDDDIKLLIDGIKE